MTSNIILVIVLVLGIVTLLVVWMIDKKRPNKRVRLLRKYNKIKHIFYSKMTRPQLKLCKEFFENELLFVYRYSSWTWSDLKDDMRQVELNKINKYF